MIDVVELLMQTPDVLEPFVEIRRRFENVLNDANVLIENTPEDVPSEFTKLLQPIVLDLTSDTSIRERIEEQLATKSGQLLTQIVTRNKFAREQQALHLLFNAIVDQHDLPIEYSDLEPFLRILRRYCKEGSAETFAGVDYNIDGRVWAAGSVTAELVRLVAEMTKAGQHQRVPEVLQAIQEQFDVSPTFLLRVGAAKKLVDSPDTLLIWLRSLKGIEDEFEEFYGTDKKLPPHYFVDRLAEVAGELIQHDEAAFYSLTTMAPQLVRGAHGVYYGMECIDNVELAHKTGILDEYLEVSKDLLDRETTAALDWFHVFPRFISGGYSISDLQSLIARNGEDFLSFRHMFRPLKGAGRKLSRNFVRSKDVVENWWKEAQQLAVHNTTAACFFLKYARTIYLRFGPEFFSTWIANGKQLTELNPLIGAYFFLKSSLLADLKSPLGQQWFDRLKDLAKHTASNGGWIGNALRLMKFDERAQTDFFGRHDRLFDELSQVRNGRKFASYDFESIQSAKEADSHLRAWEMLCAHGKRQAIDAQPMTSAVQPFLAGDVQISLVHNVFCHAFLCEVFGKKQDRRSESEYSNQLIQRLEDACVQAELAVLRSLPCEIEFRSLEQIEHFGEPPKLGDLLGSVHTLHSKGFDSSWFLKRLRPAIFRQTKPRIPLLKDIFTELDRFPRSQDVTSELLLWTPGEDSLEDVIAGNENTLSCTDGPTGPHRRASIIHAVQRDAGTVLCSLVQKEGSPLPYTTFVSVPFFLADEKNGQQVLFVDSIEVGSIVHMIDNGVDVLASRLGTYLKEMAASKNLPLFISGKFFNARGRAVLTKIQEQLGMQPAEASIDIKSDDLAAIGVGWFFFESKRSGGRPWTRTTSKKRYLPVGGFKSD